MLKARDKCYIVNWYGSIREWYHSVIGYVIKIWSLVYKIFYNSAGHVHAAKLYCLTKQIVIISKFYLVMLYYKWFHNFQVGHGANGVEELRRKPRQSEPAPPNHVLLLTIFNPVYPITVVSFIIFIFNIEFYFRYYLDHVLFKYSLYLCKS